MAFLNSRKISRKIILMTLTRARRESSFTPSLGRQGEPRVLPDDRCRSPLPTGLAGQCRRTGKEVVPQFDMKILVIDVGGTHVKVLATGHKKRVEIPSGPKMHPAKMVAAVRAATAGWEYDAVSIGYPGVVLQGRPMVEPRHLAPGWVRFDFKKAFGRPVRIVNDAAMQALGSYEGGRMLFLGLGTGLGSAMIIEHVLGPMELAHLPYKKGRSYEEYVGLDGLKRLGKKKWRREVKEVVLQLKNALQAGYVVLGGGNARLVKKLPPDTRLGDNSNAFRGGFRLWNGRYAGATHKRITH